MSGYEKKQKKKRWTCLCVYHSRRTLHLIYISRVAGVNQFDDAPKGAFPMRAKEPEGVTVKPCSLGQHRASPAIAEKSGGVRALLKAGVQDDGHPFPDLPLQSWEPNFRIDVKLANLHSREVHE